MKPLCDVSLLDTAVPPGKVPGSIVLDARGLPLRFKDSHWSNGYGTAKPWRTENRAGKGERSGITTKRGH